MLCYFLFVLVETSEAARKSMGGGGEQRRRGKRRGSHLFQPQLSTSSLRGCCNVDMQREKPRKKIGDATGKLLAAYFLCLSAVSLFLLLLDLRRGGNATVIASRFDYCHWRQLKFRAISAVTDVLFVVAGT